MKYKSIELVNYAGIYNGMGLTQIKIDFTKCVSNKIIIRGANGSGKSTLMGAINPNPDNNDKFIAGAEARKTLVLADGATEYVIRYIHPITNSGRGTTKGYISKSINGQMVELNPNGNISSCKDIIYDEFGFDSGFATLAQLSSEDRGLVDKKPADRKKLVSAVTNSLDTFNAIYKSMTKKSGVLKGLINRLTSKIDMIGDETKVVATLRSIDSQLEVLESDKQKTIEAIAAVKIKISEVQESLDANNYDDVKTELITLNRIIQAAENDINKAINDYGIESPNRLESFLQYIASQIINIESIIKTLKDQIPSILTQRESEYKTLQSKQEKLKSLESSYNYSDLKAALSSTKAKLEEYEAVFSQMGLLNISLITKDEFNAAMDALNTLLVSANNLTSSYDLSYIKEDIFDRPKVLDYISKLQQYRQNLQALNERRTSVSQKLIIYQSKRELAAELINRPANCVIDDCPYIAGAFKANKDYPEEELVRLGNELNEIESDIHDLEQIISRAEQASLIRTAVGSIERELKSNIKFIMKLPVRKDFMETFFQRVVSLDPFADIDRLYKFVDCGNMIEEYKLLQEQYSVYSNEYKIYESKNSIIESIIADINDLQAKTNDLANQVQAINQQIFDKEQELENLKSSKTKLSAIYDKYTNSYIPNVSRREELNSIKITLDIGVEQIQTLRSQLNQLNNNLGSINSDIRNLTDKRQSLQHSLIMLAEYKTELEKYNSEYTLIEKIRYYASPNTGIQSIFIGIFMNKILSTANELLGMLFGGEFILQPFIVNESEFRIPCIGSGLSHDDISSMSSAQRCMISMIISFALLNQSSTKYNIINLDEMDAMLDTTNRGGFVGLLDNLMSMLHCEQAFIISHNNELNTSMADIIVLKDNTNEISNGHIIWKY